MRARTFAALMVALLLASPIAAQEQRGSIEGVVKDTSGAVLPGVTVEGKDRHRRRSCPPRPTRTASFRFPSVAPGMYEVTRHAAGLLARNRCRRDRRPWTDQEGRLRAGACQGVTESVQVTAESPLVDVKQSARQTNIRAEQIELLPKGRDFTTLVTQAPGANQETKLGGLSIDGASAGENRYIIDGIETTDLQSGISGKRRHRRLRRRGAGQVERLHRRVRRRHRRRHQRHDQERHERPVTATPCSTGKATSSRRASRLQPASPGSTISTGVPTLRLNSGRHAAEYVTYPEDKSNRIEPGFALGGPIVANRAWFFGAYQPSLTSTERNVTASSSGNPDAAPTTVERKAAGAIHHCQPTAQLTDSLRARVAFNNSWSKRDGLLPALNGTDPDGTELRQDVRIPELLDLR